MSRRGASERAPQEQRGEKRERSRAPLLSQEGEREEQKEKKEREPWEKERRESRSASQKREAKGGEELLELLESLLEKGEASFSPISDEAKLESPISELTSGASDAGLA